jgi:uridylate kinase
MLSGKAFVPGMGIVRWLRLFGQVFRFLSGRIVQLVVVVGGGNVKIGFIDFQGLVGRSENSSIVFRAFHETGISTACFVAR